MANKTDATIKTSIGTRRRLVSNTCYFIFSIRWQTGLLIFCILMFTQCESSAQKLSNYYVTSSQPEGVLYFIKPQTNFFTPSAKKEFIMDVTYPDYKDTAIINFTFFDKEDIHLQTITVAYNNWQYQSVVQRIYIDREKKQWRYRYSFQIPFEQLVFFYRAKTPILTLTTNSSSTITIKPMKQWEKNSEVNNRIIQVIQKNKN